MYEKDKQRRAYVADRLTGKNSREEANYRPHDDADSKDSCFECNNYMNSGQDSSSCRKVAGVVKAEDTCDLWEARTDENSAQPQITIQLGKG